MDTKNLSRLHALLCAFVLAACVLVAHPYVEMGVNDDWSYIRTAQLMAQTGHIVYNGWATAMLGWQILLGAAFIKLFGFSFTVTRVPVFLLSLLTAYLLHRITVRFGLNTWNATLITLTVVLSPTFLPLAFSFMSDVPGFLCILICLYACQRAVASTSRNAALGWLYFAAVSNILDGTVRQIAWLGVLVMVPCAAWLMRDRKGILLHGLLLSLLGFVSALACMHWFALQPYSVGDELLEEPLSAHLLRHLAQMIIKAVLSLILFSLPILVVFPLRLFELGRRRAIPALAIIGAVTLLLTIVASVEYKHGLPLDVFLMPWLVNLLTIRGIEQFNEIPGLQPIILHGLVRVLLTLLTIICGSSTLAYVLLARNRGPHKETFKLDQAAPSTSPRSPMLSWTQTAVLLLPFTLAYLALLMPRAASTTHTLFDRYTTPMVFVLGVFALRFLQEHSRQQTYVLSTAMLLVFTGYTVAGTHDLYTLDRARLAATNELEKAGIDRAAIEGGFEYDAWTQLLASGYVNDPHLTNPPGAYKPMPHLSDPCAYFYRPYTPALHPKYSLTFDTATCYTPSTFPAVPYDNWLPPFHRKVYIQTVAP